MDEAQQTIQVLNEVADISQQLSILQMLFFIIIIGILAGMVVFAIVMYFAIGNARADNRQNAHLLNTFSTLIAEFRQTQQVYWIKNNENQQQIMQGTQMQNRISRSILNSFKQIVVILQASNLLDTKQVKAITDDELST